jgi:hypothetical protein
MDIRQALLAEHSKWQTMAIVEYVGDDTKRFAELMKIFFAGDYRLTQRAAWPMNYCAEKHPELIYPYLPKLLNCLSQDDGHDAVKRNIVRLLQYVEIPKRFLGKVYSLCVDLINDPSEPIAVRAFALTVAARIAKAEPALLSELQLIVRQHLPHSTAAFQKRAQEILSPA